MPPAFRPRFAVSFAAILLLAGYLGLSNDKIPTYGQSDKGLHFITFFLLTITAYWSVELPRRRLVHLTLLTCTAGLAIGSEVVQALLPNGRLFDPYDILANVLGSALALVLSSWYHKRMLERKRKNKHYDIVPGEDLEAGEGEGDVELGEGMGAQGQQSGVVGSRDGGDASAGAGRGPTVTEELDNWDENASDWDEEPDGKGDGQRTPGSSAEEGEDGGKKRAD